jgi:hypothetical protein
VSQHLIDWENPLNIDHPLAQGMSGLWIPGGEGPLYGVPKLYDLAGNNHGVLTPAGPTGPTWDSRSHVGGFGSVRTTGTEYISFGQSAAFHSASTTWMWSCTPSVLANEKMMLCARDGGGTRLQTQLQATGALAWWNGVSFDLTAGGFFVANETTHVAITFVSGAGSFGLYRNGVLFSTPAYPFGGTTLRECYWGATNTGSVYANKFEGRVNGIQILDRALSASEVWHLYQESLKGYPTLLNRVRPRRFFFQSGGGGAIDLFALDLSHSHTLAAEPLSQTHPLSAESIAHAHAISAEPLGQTHPLAAESLAHSHTIGEAALSQTHPLTVDAAGLAHSHAIGIGEINNAVPLEAEPLAHATTIGIAALQQTHELAALPLSHAHAIAAEPLAQSHALQASGLAHAHAIASEPLGAVFDLLAAGLVHGCEIGIGVLGGVVSGLTPEIIIRPRFAQRRRIFSRTERLIQGKRQLRRVE